MGAAQSCGTGGNRSQGFHVPERGMGFYGPPASAESVVSLLRGVADGDISEKYRFGKLLGTGGYAVVRAATLNNGSGLRVAIKQVCLPEGDADSLAKASSLSQSSGASGRPISISRVRSPGWKALPQEVPRQFVDKQGIGERFGRSKDNKQVNASASTQPPTRTQALEDIANEVCILQRLNHPSILRLYEHYVSPSGDKVSMVTELLEGGELLEALLDRGSYSERETRMIFKPARPTPYPTAVPAYTILEGLEYVHASGFVHRDVKLENLMLAAPGDLSSVRLIDFGLAREVERASDSSQAGRICGTPSYVAPEVIQGGHFSPAVDCWAAGIILYVLLSGVVPFSPPRSKEKDPEHKELFGAIRRGEFSLDGPEFVGVSALAKDLILRLMTLRPERRCTASQALEHRWMQLPAREVSNAPLARAASRLVETVNKMRLPLVTFAPGQFIVSPGDNAHGQVYLLRRGQAEVLAASSGVPSGAYDSDEEEEGAAVPTYRYIDGAVPARAAPQQSPQPFGGIFSGDGGLVKVSVVAEGDFVGELPKRGARRAGPSPSGIGRTSGAPATPPLQQLAQGALRLGDTLSAFDGPAYSVRAVTQVQAVLLKASALDWVLDRDPLLRSQMEGVIRQRWRECSRSQPDPSGAAEHSPLILCMPFMQPLDPQKLLCGVQHNIQKGLQDAGGHLQGFFAHGLGGPPAGRYSTSTSKPHRQRSLKGVAQQPGPPGGDSGSSESPTGPPTPPPTISSARRATPLDRSGLRKSDVDTRR